MMGLDTTHNCWHGPYSSFMRWREEVALAVGVPLRLMEGFYSPPEEDLVARSAPRAEAFAYQEGGGFLATRDSLTGALADALQRGDAGRWESWASLFTKYLPIPWESLRPDPLHVLLSHSDCDGEIAVEDCLPLAARLEEIAPLLPDEPAWHRGEGARAKALQFAAGLREAAAAGEPIGFH